MTRTPHEILAGAYNVLEQRGWCQGNLGRGAYSPVCLLGALHLADGGKAPNVEGVDEEIYASFLHGVRLETLEALQIPKGQERDLVDAVWRWNDRQHAATVKAKLARAIAATAPAPDLDFLKDPADAQTA